MRYLKKTQVFQRPYSFNTKANLKTWVPFYSVELEKFENIFIVFVLQYFCLKCAFVCAWLKITNFWHFRKRKQLHTTVCCNV